MAKRYTDSRKWDDPFFLDLSNEYKLLWIYILDKCNHAGIYKQNPRMADFCLNHKFDWKEVLGVFKGRIQSLNNEKWFISKFIEYQYGVLNKNNRVHNSIIEILKKEGVYKDCLSTVNGYKDKDKDKEQDKDMDKDKEKHGEFVKLTQNEYNKLIMKFKSADKANLMIERLNNYIGSKGKKYKSHYHTILSWSSKDEKDNTVSKYNKTTQRNLKKLEEL